MSDLMKVGPDWGTTGTFKPFTSGLSGAQRATNAHGMFMDAALGGRLFGTGTATLVSISNATFTVGNLTATATPITGVWNPASSAVNLVILQASLGVTMSAATSTGTGGFVWCVSVGNAVVTGGIAPFNRRTLVASGSGAKGFAGTALTGLTNAMVVMGGSSLGGGSSMSYSNVGTAAGAATVLQGFVEYFDGSLVVPPGGIIGLQAMITPVAHSAVSTLLWEEVPILP